MPVSSTPYPILSRFICAVVQTTGMPPQPLDAEAAPQHSRDDTQAQAPKKFPKGVVLGADGKPCRSCTSVASWAAMIKQQTKNPSTIAKSTPPAISTSSIEPPGGCPPDVEQLGRSSWTLLHSITATYPVRPSQELQHETAKFLSTFSKLYPCWTCAEDFQRWLAVDTNAPRVSSRDEFGRWMCEAHNEVNVKLGKEKFDCNRWEERWRTGWKDGSCD
ncbi:hypothetical protein W97_04823 [Coniosporium apollinis CBS 100218]|uniref:Sulfhydryl oxidase n=1 Tax=Coniosporium apollinis (strain CBS 100218) TaxID=1168221 RepID=R7YUL8_CONA1|nr:uncharacterized protein W97_04823 [Coniosporium apollinis CBS 100218]EON65585.1 hypothetical protein W97_04823 [Coniosporium apollinis CBS 100218]